MNMNLEDVPVYTLRGIKHLYKLGDGAYGEWLIFKNKVPIYYLNIFDEMYAGIDPSLAKDPRNYLDKKFKTEKQGYSLSQNIRGIWSGNVTLKNFEIEKLPVSFFF